MERKVSRVVLLFLVVLFLTSCQEASKKKSDPMAGVSNNVQSTDPGKYLPKHALKDPIDRVSILHPVSLEKRKIKTVTFFTVIMNPGLWAETVAGGGVWSVLGCDNSGQLIKGSAYFFGQIQPQNLLIFYQGDIPLTVRLPYSIRQLRQFKFVLSNADGGWLYTLDGLEVKGNPAYNPKKFDKDKDYQAKLVQKYGMNFDQLKQYYQARRVEPDIYEIRVGSRAWQEHIRGVNNQIKAKKLYGYKLWNGEVRYGYLPLNNFEDVAGEIPGFNTGWRYLKRGKLVFGLSSFFGGVSSLITAGVVVLGDVLGAAIDDNWDGPYFRATAHRRDMALTFQYFNWLNKRRLVEMQKSTK